MNKQLVLTPLFVATIILLVGCGSALPSTSRQTPAGAVKSGVPASAPPAGAANVRTESHPAPAASIAAPAGSAQAALPLPPLPPANPMIIKNGNLSILVGDPEAALSQVDQIVQSSQGVIVSQTVRTDGDKTFATLTIHVPPDQFEQTLARLRDLRAQGTHVLTDTVSSQDVTEQYVDLDAQFHNLQSTRDAYQNLLQKATSVTDIIILTREIASIQTQMDQIKARQNILARQAGVSTITLNLSPFGVAPLPGPQPLPRPWQAAQQAWQALLAGLQGLAVVLIWMAVLLPLPAAAIVAAWVIYRRVTHARPVA